MQKPFVRIKVRDERVLLRSLGSSEERHEGAKEGATDSDHKAFGSVSDGDRTVRVARASGPRAGGTRRSTEGLGLREADGSGLRRRLGRGGCSRRDAEEYTYSQTVLTVNDDQDMDTHAELAAPESLSVFRSTWSMM